MATKIYGRIHFREMALGTSPANKQVYTDFIGSKAPDAKSLEEEVRTLGEDEVIEKSMTVFHRLPVGHVLPNGKVLAEETPVFWDYQLKGFFKDAGSMLSRILNESPGEVDENGKKKKGTKKDRAATISGSITAHKKIIDGTIFVEPRMIPIIIPEGGEIGQCERPLRAQTAQGERVALANSESIPAGSYIDIAVITLSDEYIDWIMEMLQYGVFRGLGCWRNSGMGRFVFEETKRETVPFSELLKYKYKAELEAVQNKSEPSDEIDDEYQYAITTSIGSDKRIGLQHESSTINTPKRRGRPPKAK